MKILVTSDEHVGSAFAICPPEAQIVEGDNSRDAVLNSVQKYLNKCWQHMLRTIGPIDVLLLNGDAIDGENPKEQGQYLTIPRAADQVDAAVQLLGPLREHAKRFFLTRGSPYHDGHSSTQAVDAIAGILKADRWPSGLRTGIHFWHEFAGKTVNMSHHQTRGFLYPAGGADRLALFNAAAAEMKKQPHADIIIRSHNHLLRVVSAYGRKVIFTGAWKAITPFAERVMEGTRATLYSDIGAVLIEITPKGNVWIDDTTFAYTPMPIEIGGS